MAAHGGNTTDLGKDECEMSVDSGYSASKDSTISSDVHSQSDMHSQSDIHSHSGDSTATLVEQEEKVANSVHSQEHADSGYSSVATNQSQAPGAAQFQNLSQASLPHETADPTARTQKWIEETFEVFVKNLDGKTHVIEVDKNEEISAFRHKVGTRLGVPGDQQRLTSQAGRTLEDGRSLCDYDIKKHSTVYCQGRLRGGHKVVSQLDFFFIFL